MATGSREKQQIIESTIMDKYLKFKEDMKQLLRSGAVNGKYSCSCTSSVRNFIPSRHMDPDTEYANARYVAKLLCNLFQNDKDFLGIKISGNAAGNSAWRAVKITFDWS